MAVKRTGPPFQGSLFFREQKPEGLRLLGRTLLRLRRAGLPLRGVGLGDLPAAGLAVGLLAGDDADPGDLGGGAEGEDFPDLVEVGCGADILPLLVLGGKRELAEEVGVLGSTDGLRGDC